MPMTPQQMEQEILMLKALVARQNERISTLERTGANPQLARIAEALNQFGAYYTRELPHQNLTNQPAQPWRPV